MRITIPIAGPDYFKENKIKGLENTPKGPLLLNIIKSRLWYKKIKPNDYTFVMLDSCLSRTFFENHLSNWLPGCKAIFLSDISRGAAFSSLASLSIESEYKKPFLIDLADIFFETDHMPFDRTSEKIGAMGYCFESDNEIYSYFKLNKNSDYVDYTAEKRVISNYASAGVYGFINTATYLKAFAKCIENNEKYFYKSLLYVCPVLNGVIKNDQKVYISKVKNVLDVKKFD